MGRRADDPDPDTSQGQVYKSDIEPNLAPGKTVMFAHGFNIRFGTIQVRDDVDVSMVAPSRPATASASCSVEGAARRRCSP
jgi:ketol-acid reductoisomerase